jgi:methylated-DNA-[protein]-cysteine S-methyltransferase
MHLRLDQYLSPLSTLLLVTDDDGALRALDFADHQARMRRLLREHYGEFALNKDKSPRSIIRALDGYFDGDLSALDAVPIAAGGTSFQREVWMAVRAIPPGTTSSYGDIAARIGRPLASRAVGAANGANPIPIVVPCHRVIGSNGALTGYGGGLPRKRWLLEHERRYEEHLATTHADAAGHVARQNAGTKSPKYSACTVWGAPPRGNLPW